MDDIFQYIRVVAAPCFSSPMLAAALAIAILNIELHVAGLRNQRQLT
ncbi:MAG: hypothetical protein L3J28_10230 [Candidatus Polarisedimenticolaceae bacterium]|nr:hypothetical protein [Candidatus Polarisedimenticolaceae bacterium]